MPKEPENSAEIVESVFTQLVELLRYILEDSRKTREILIATRPSGATDRINAVDRRMVEQWNRQNQFEKDLASVVVSMATLAREFHEFRDWVMPWHIRLRKRFKMWRDNGKR